ncbi:hypothetical protein FRC0316_00298 [Corynebacterium diphtheriae]|nr:hypothetical protein [Corynebacterium diphtheriae]UJM22112.1 hypothetical protein FE377_01520 [Corynebacterium diphtheriae]CAB0490161.1 hypothetical protein CIP100161_00232 [Corynebacterium diphtheriae]CAB0629087.1 hypothetical protein FRC0016_00228 [Corynebacterium diphtheriae]CAB0786306.1 hypothetical protein FRC0213_00224 [Corynebacterium diphtheriae]CAB0832237.1 hypothetical protein FRC0295_00274 [Corynebacterium diphtheriae]
MRKFIAGAASFLVLAGGSGMAHAVTSEQVPNEVVTNGTVDQRRVSSLELSREPNERRDQLLNEGFLKEAEQEFPRYTIETYRNTSNGVTVEYDVVAWNKIASRHAILSDQTCYDLSQFINIGWKRAPQEKRA